MNQLQMRRELDLCKDASAYARLAAAVFIGASLAVSLEMRPTIDTFLLLLGAIVATAIVGNSAMARADKLTTQISKLEQLTPTRRDPS